MESLNTADLAEADVVRGGAMAERLALHGTYEAVCYGPDGALKWADRIENTVVTVGKNYSLEATLAASALTTVGPFMGLISSVGYSAIAAGDTMASHAGWTEAGGANAPTYTAPRKTCVFSAAAAGVKALSAALSYAITGAGTLKGAFVVTGTGALATIDNTAGTLLSAGLFSGGDKVVSNGDTVNVSWSLAA
jgi:hypothetical protein